MSSANPALAQFIRSIPLFSLVDEQDLQEVLRLFRPVELNAGDVLFGEGDPGKAMWVLGEGTEVSVATTAGQNRPVVVAYAKKGDVLGEMALVDDGPRSGTAIVVQSGPAHQIDANEFHAMRSSFVPAAFKVLRKICMDLCVRLRQTNERIVPSGHSGIHTPPLPAGPHPDTALLDRYPAFKTLPAIVKFALAQKLEVIHLEDMTPIFAEGEPSDGAYFIVEGEVSVGRNGKTLANLPSGTMFGVVACIDAGVRSASCVATGPAVLLKMSDRDFDQLFASGHRFAFQMVDLLARQLVQHLRDANMMLPLPGRQSGIAKVARPVEKMLPSEPSPADLDAIGNELEVEAALPIEMELDLGEFTPESEALG
ncbi:MAG: cyclic nucleotide-binding domain-containing protein [Myxococcaceae bacterium]